MFLVLGLRPGELFALRWNDKAQNSLCIDSSITDGIEVDTKTEGSNTNVWVPLSTLSSIGGGRSAMTPRQTRSSSPPREAPRSTRTISSSGS
jgi:hypothetical protein